MIDVELYRALTIGFFLSIWFSSQQHDKNENQVPSQQNKVRIFVIKGIKKKKGICVCGSVSVFLYYMQNADRIL